MRLVSFNRACYVPYLKHWKHPYASPIYADLKNFPDTFIFVAGADPLCDDNVAFAEKLKKESSSKALLKIYPDMPHSFHCHMDIAPEEAEKVPPQDCQARIRFKDIKNIRVISLDSSCILLCHKSQSPSAQRA
jgi:acetyl esterase/lipase